MNLCTVWFVNPSKMHVQSSNRANAQSSSGPVCSHPVGPDLPAHSEAYSSSIWTCARQNQQNDAQSDQSCCYPHEETLSPKLPLSAQQRLWSDWVDAQADLSLCWAHRSFCWFCCAMAHLFCAYSKGSGKTTWMQMLAWVFADRLRGM